MDDAPDPVDPADLRRLRGRTDWATAQGAPDAPDAAADGDAATRARAAECAASGHLAVVMEPDDVPRCRHCGASLSPDALRRAGIRGSKA